MREESTHGTRPSEPAIVVIMLTVIGTIVVAATLFVNFVPWLIA